MGTESQLHAAEQLLIAADMVSEFMPDGRDRTDVLRRLGLAIAALKENDSRAMCRRCNQVFSFSSVWFSKNGLSLPRHCAACRLTRRMERERAGVRVYEGPTSHAGQG